MRTRTLLSLSTGLLVAILAVDTANLCLSINPNRNGFLSEGTEPATRPDPPHPTVGQTNGLSLVAANEEKAPANKTHPAADALPPPVALPGPAALRPAIPLKTPPVPTGRDTGLSVTLEQKTGPTDNPASFAATRSVVLETDRTDTAPPLSRKELSFSVAHQPTDKNRIFSGTLVPGR